MSILITLSLLAFILVAFRFPNDKETYPMDKQFLLGPALLITPVLVQVGSAFFSLCQPYVHVACFRHIFSLLSTYF